MTEQELIKHEWQPKNCKIGVLYFKDGFFCRFDRENKDDVVLFSVVDDMTPLGKAKTFEEIDELERVYYWDEIEFLQKKLRLAKQAYKQRWG